MAVAPTEGTAEHYYEADFDNQGGYAYTTLEEVINNYMMSMDDDDYSANTPRHRVLYQAMRGLREFYYDIAREVRAIEQDLSSLQTITVPPDFVSWVRISYLDKDGQMIPMAEDRRMSIADVYLQDNDYNLIFDGDGEVITASKLKNTSNGPSTPNAESYSGYPICNAFNPNKNASKVFNNGKFKYDKSTGKIHFSSDSVGKHIVLEYISDGLFRGGEAQASGDIRVHKFLETALIDFIHHELVKNRRNVPYNEKVRARKEFYNSRRIGKRRLGGFNFEEIKQVFKGDSKWIK